MPTVSMSGPSTDSQINYINKLIEERETPFTTSIAQADFTKQQASDLIQSLLKYPLKPKPTPVQALAITSDGMYQDPTTSTIYKVVFNKATGDGKRMYAKKLVVHHGDDSSPNKIGVTFEYAPGAVKLIKPEWHMTLEQAAQFGQLYGVCCRCGRNLTNELSIELGIGPICREWFA